MHMMLACLLDRLPMEAVCETARLWIDDHSNAPMTAYCAAHNANAVILRWLYDLWYVWRITDARCSQCMGQCAKKSHIWGELRCGGHYDNTQWCNANLCSWPIDDELCAYVSRILEEHAASGPKRYNGLFFCHDPRSSIVW